jgi:hypothetical protein
MDFTQTKLTKMEWQMIEQPLNQKESSVLSLIKDGMANVEIAVNTNMSLFQYLKVSYSTEMEDHLYNIYFSTIVGKIKHNEPELTIQSSLKPKIKTADKIRLEQNKKSIENIAFEFVMLKHIEAISNNSSNFEFHYYTLYHLSKVSIPYLNRHIIHVSQHILNKYKNHSPLQRYVLKSVNIIEKNTNLLKYKNMTLYDHQKQIYQAVKKSTPKLILYIAPTGTGKTLTPIGLSEQYKVIFVCAARHVGLSLARSAISIEKKVAFAFGCNSTNDIRLHYYAAADYTVNRHGGIGRVDNSNGCKVEIIICDVKSYLHAMSYMMLFNLAENLIVYWDEPTIAMDYSEHELHDIIHTNWVENIIPNVVLSSATLPKCKDLPNVTSDFKNRFEGAEIINIVSHECVKTIPILDNSGNIFVPHYASRNYCEVFDMAMYCSTNLTLLRYLDLGEIISFLSRLTEMGQITLEEYFTDIEDITMEKIKLYYLQTLMNLDPDIWETLYDELIISRKTYIDALNLSTTASVSGTPIKKSFSVQSSISNSVISTKANEKDNSLRRLHSVQDISQETSISSPIPTHITEKIGTFGLYITTNDAHTLTDGPTIFLAEDVEKIATFCIQQAKIPSVVIDDMLSKIEKNNKLSERISVLEKELEDLQEAGKDKDKDRDGDDSDKRSTKGSGNKGSGGSNKIKLELDNLRMLVRPINLYETFIPNTQAHLKKWAPNNINIGTPFTCNLDEETIVEIMSLNNVNTVWKILLLMGIGIFATHQNHRYLEIIKQLASKQQLYLIIASSDYIYGTNYQFCHGYLSKDLTLTQEKIIQSIGRIGRNNIQQNYSIRMRDNNAIKTLFTEQGITPEIINMNRLFIRD